MQKRVRELLFQCLVQPYILLFCFELKSLCILFPLSFYLAKSLNSCSHTQPDSCAEWSKAAVRSNSTIFAGKKNRDIPGFWYCYWSKPIFPPLLLQWCKWPSPQKKGLAWFYGSQLQFVHLNYLFVVLALFHSSQLGELIEYLCLSEMPSITSLE